MKIQLPKTVPSDLEVLFEFQNDDTASMMAAFTSDNSHDKKLYLRKWEAILKDETKNVQTIVSNGIILGSISKYTLFDEPEITYWIDRKYWGNGIASEALNLFVEIEKVRPLFGRAASDNLGSRKVMEKCGFHKIGVDSGFANSRGKEIEETIYRLDN